MRITSIKHNAVTTISDSVFIISRWQPIPVNRCGFMIWQLLVLLPQYRQPHSGRQHISDVQNLMYYWHSSITKLHNKASSSTFHMCAYDAGRLYATHTFEIKNYKLNYQQPRKFVHLCYLHISMQNICKVSQH